MLGSWSSGRVGLMRALALVLSSALVTLGLLVLPTAAPATAADCATTPSACPAGLLNAALLQDPNSLYVATTQQRISLQQLQQQAISNTLQDHALPASDADAVATWGRGDALAELWGLVVEAIRTPTATRTTQQQDVVNWLTAMIRRKGEAAAVNAGWEYLKWAGNTPGTGGRPATDTIKTALQGFVNGTRTPVNYNNGSPSNSTSGFCYYQPPAGVENEYSGNIFTPPLQSTADSWCFPNFQCLNLLGCNANTPSFESFVKWGEIDVTGDPRQDNDFAVAAKDAAIGLTFAAAASGALVTGVVLAASLGSVLTGTAFAAALFPWLAAPILDFAGALTLPAAYVGGAAAAAVGVIVGVVIVAITIAVLKGIEIVAAANLPGKLLDMINNAQAAAPDLPAMLTDTNQLSGLYGLFIRATGPVPVNQTCDNSTKNALVQGKAPTPCSNAPAIPGPSVDDPQFLVQPLNQSTGAPDGAAIRTDSIDWVSLQDLSGNTSGIPLLNPTTVIGRTELRGSWFRTSATVDDGTVVAPYQTLRLNYLSYKTFSQTTSWLIKQGDGSYKFLTATGKSVLFPSNEPFDASTCKASGRCELSTTLHMVKVGPGGVTDDGILFDVSVVPRVAPTIGVTTTAPPVSGSASTLKAASIGADVGPLTYEWWVVRPSGAPISCSITNPPRFCDADGPFTGSQIEYTWTTGGPTKVIVFARTASGLEYRTDTTIDVTNVAPQLTADAPAETRIPGKMTLTGTVTHAGVFDTENVVIDWGDGTTDGAVWAPFNIICVSCPTSFSKISDTKVSYQSTHEYAAPGTYTVKVKVNDLLGDVDEETLSVKVIGTQVLTFPSVAGHTYGDAPFEVAASGGLSTEEVNVSSATPAVCSVGTPTYGRSDGAATVAATVTLESAGQCQLVATQGGSDSYDAADQVSHTFTVARASLTVTAVDKTMLLGGTAPELSTSYVGFVNGEGRSVLSGLTCASIDGAGRPVGARTPVGTYPITCSGASAANYAITYQAGSLHVGYQFLNPRGGIFGTGVTRVKAGANVTITWILRDALGRSVRTRSSLSSITVSPMTCGATPPTGGTTLVKATTALRYEASSGTWQYNWKTHRSLSGCHAVTLHLADGTTHTGRLRFR